MISKDLKNLLVGIYGALVLEDVLPHKWRRLALHLFGSVAVILLGVMVLGNGALDIKIKGGFFLCLSIALLFASLEAYFYSVFTRANEGRWKVPFEIGRIIFYADDEDLARGFLYSDIGDEAVRRLGFTEGEIKDFLQSRVASTSGSAFADLEAHISAEDYAKILLKEDKGLASFLFSKGLGEREFAGVLRWVTDKEKRETERERWWSREALARIPGIGKNWSYGETYLLLRYGEDLTESRSDAPASLEKTAKKAIARLESVLARGRGANAVIVSDSESSRRDILSLLAAKISGGNAYPALEHKRLFLLNSNLLIENSHDKISFEGNFAQMLMQSARAGNVILAIPYFTSFIKSASALGSDAVSVLTPYLASPSIHIIALDSESDYHGFLSGRETIAQSFEMIKADEGSDEGLLFMLGEEAEEIERASRVLVSYPALMAVADSTKRYFDLSAIDTRARETLVESISHALGAGRKIVLKEDIQALVEAKTGIPTGAPKAEERETLLKLEEHLHERIVGQNEAVKAVSDALKRSRAGVKNPDKPIGTFLFLGPTGVGKTETTKALADIFFGSEERMSRLDMSEYRDAFAMERLIGSFGTGKAGALSLSLREKPYGVLLLDEFEKTTGDIMNLFLRIFDEGVFTDAEGRKVNAKNNIIIATSNAGSELIWEIIKKGENLAAKKDEVIDMIIRNGIFNPELLNRFDAIVLFHPLLKDDLEKVAKMMIAKFARRMRAQGIAVEASQGALDFLVARGTDPKFGARPMNRALQEEVEKLMAEKIISGEIKEGKKVTFEMGQDGALQMKTL